MALVFVLGISPDFHKEVSFELLSNQQQELSSTVCTRQGHSLGAKE